jgi:hypothetical protein
VLSEGHLEVLDDHGTNEFCFAVLSSPNITNPLVNFWRDDLTSATVGEILSGGEPKIDIPSLRRDCKCYIACSLCRAGKSGRTCSYAWRACEIGGPIAERK